MFRDPDRIGYTLNGNNKSEVFYSKLRKKLIAVGVVTYYFRKSVFAVAVLVIVFIVTTTVALV